MRFTHGKFLLTAAVTVALSACGGSSGSDDDNNDNGSGGQPPGTPVTVVGRVVDSPIAHATVTITFDGNRYEVEADEQGYYELPVELYAQEDNEVVRVTARGNEANEQGHVTLSSILVSSEELIERANADGEVTRDELHEVTVTHVTTARDVLTRRAARDEVLTAANVAEFGNTIDPQLLLQMAGVIKLIIDDEDFALPEDFESIEKFLEDAESYNEFVEEASQGGENSPLNRAIEETLEDPDVMPELRLEDLYGRYMDMIRAPGFLMPNTLGYSNTWDFNQDGVLLWTRDHSDENIPERRSVKLNGNMLELDGESPISEVSWWQPIGEWFFEGHPETKEAWIAYNGWDQFQPVQLRVTNYQWFESLRVASVSEHEIIARYTSRHIQSPNYSFEYNGQEYSIPSVESTGQRDVRLANVEAFKQSDLTFDLDTHPVWLIQVDLSEALPYKFHADGTYEVLAQDKLEIWEYDGTWTLSEDKRTLILQDDGVVSDGFDDVTRLTRHRAEDEYQSVLAEIIIDGVGELNHLFSAMPLPAESDFSAIETVIESDLVFNSIVNRSAEINWDENDRLRVQNFMFDFFADGTGHQYNGLCKGERLFSTVELCSEPMTAQLDIELSWEDIEIEGLGEVLRFQRHLDGSQDYYRHWIPLNLSSRDILTVFEWEITEYDGRAHGYIVPRINYYQLTEKPPLHEASASAVGFSMFAEPSADSPSVLTELGYKIVNPQQQPEHGIKH